MGAFFLFTLFSLWGVNFFLASLLSVLGVGLVGAIVERLILRRLRSEPIEIPMLATVALSPLSRTKLSHRSRSPWRKRAKRR